MAKKKTVKKKSKAIKKAVKKTATKKKTKAKKSVKKKAAKLKNSTQSSKLHFAVTVQLESDVTAIYEYPDRASAESFYNDVTSQGLKATITESR